jgi:hypothetical protein
MALSRVKLDLLFNTIDEIKSKKGKLSDSIVTQLHTQGFNHTAALKDFFNECIVPHLSDEELFNLTWAFMRAHKLNEPLLRSQGLLSGDLYVAFAKRMNYIPGKSSIPAMDVLNWYVYQDRKQSAKDTVTVIKFKFAKVASTLAEATHQQSETDKHTPEEIANIVNERVKGSEFDYLSYQQLMFNPNNLPGNAAYMKAAIEKKAQAATSKRPENAETIQKKTKKLKEALIALTEECASYQNHLKSIVAAEIKRVLKRIGKENKDETTEVMRLLALKDDNEVIVQAKNKYGLSQQYTQNRRLEYAEKKINVLRSLTANSINNNKLTSNEDKVTTFAKQFKKLEDEFKQSADPKTEAWIKRIKIILTACTIGVAAIPLMAYSKFTTGSLNYLKSRDEVFRSEAEEAGKVSALFRK